MKTAWHFMLGLIVCMTLASYTADAESLLSVTVEPMAIGGPRDVTRPGNAEMPFMALTLSSVSPWRGTRLSLGVSYYEYGGGKVAEPGASPEIRDPHVGALGGSLWEPGVEFSLGTRGNYLALAYLYGPADYFYVGIRDGLGLVAPLHFESASARGVKIGAVMHLSEMLSLSLCWRLIEISHTLVKKFDVISAGLRVDFF